MSVTVFKILIFPFFSIQMCVTLNDIEYVRRNLSLLPNELQLDPLLETIESADRENFECREEVSSLLDTTVNEMESQISMIVSYIGMKVT